MLKQEITKVHVKRFWDDKKELLLTDKKYDTTLCTCIAFYILTNPVTFVNALTVFSPPIPTKGQYVKHPWHNA